MIRTPLIDLDSIMNLYKIYNLPIYNHHIGKSLQYLLEGSNLAITKDNKYTAILSDMEFIKCTLADGHFCVLNTGLYHVDTSQWCVTALFSRVMTKLTAIADLPYSISLGHRPITLTKACGLSLLK